MLHDGRTKSSNKLPGLHTAADGSPSAAVDTIRSTNAALHTAQILPAEEHELGLQTRSSGVKQDFVIHSHRPQSYT